MKCHEIDQNLTAYLHGEVGRSERELIRAHVSHCERCQRQVAQLSWMQSQLSHALHVAADDVKPSPHAWARLQESIALQRRPAFTERLKQALAQVAMRNANIARNMLFLVTVTMLSAIAIGVVLQSQPANVAMPGVALPSTTLKPQRISGPLDDWGEISRRGWETVSALAANRPAPSPDPDANTTASTGDWLFLLGTTEDMQPVRACANCAQLQ